MTAGTLRMAMPEGARSVLVKYDVNRLSPNQRIHWRERSTRNKAAKLMAEWAWRAQGRPGFGAQDCPCWYHIVIFRGRRIDQDNAVAACKAILDGLFHGQILPDDSEKYAKLHGIEQMISKGWKGCEAVQVTVWSAKNAP